MFIIDSMLREKACLNKLLKRLKLYRVGSLIVVKLSQKSITKRTEKSPGVWILTNKLLNNSWNKNYLELKGNENISQEGSLDLCTESGEVSLPFSDLLTWETCHFIKNHILTLCLKRDLYLILGLGGPWRQMVKYFGSGPRAAIPWNTRIFFYFTVRDGVVS